MLFNSTTFVVFFVVVLIVVRLLGSWTHRKLFLLGASYLFYAAWSAPFVLLLWISTLVDWFVARAMARTEAPRARTGLLLISLAVNLGLLGFFKYGMFVADNTVLGLQAFGFAIESPALDIILPVGISFYTFQTLSYTIDVYRRELEPSHAFVDFALYVTFFPQLVAGPIVRASTFLPQARTPHPVKPGHLGWGLALFVFGLFEKSVVADVLCAPYAERLFDGSASADLVSAWTGTLAFAGQIYGDFAGYSTCAIGVAMTLGFALPDNFRAPYAAIGMSDFWRRWHISLSTWLRDYLYVPLGGNRGTWWATQRNLMITMLLGGLWHGASWNFVIWGGLHGLLLIIERIVRRLVPNVPRSLAVQAYGMFFTFAAVCVTWVFFRAPTLERAVSVVGSMFGVGSGERLYSMGDEAIVFGTMGLMITGHLFMRNRTLEGTLGRLPQWARGVVLAVILALVLATPGVDRAFLYFQF